MPKWWDNLMMPLELLFFALFFALLRRLAHKQGTDGDYLRTLKIWIWAQGVLFIVFTVLVYTMEKIFMIPFGAIYLSSLGLATGVTIRMRETIETTGALAS